LHYSPVNIFLQSAPALPFAVDQAIERAQTLVKKIIATFLTERSAAVKLFSKKIIAALLGTLVFACAPANATVVNFDDLRFNGTMAGIT
jgi:hypothetical protein